MLRHFIWANGLDGVGDALGVVDGFGDAAAEALGTGAGMFGCATLGCGAGSTKENIATMSASIGCMQILLTSGYVTQ
jgi:hypothetical protein